MKRVEICVKYLKLVVLEKGEFAAISGPSGSGKSTILNMVGLIDLPSDGSIIIGGTSDFGVGKL